MIDFRRLFAGLAQAVQSVDRQDGSGIAKLLDLDTSAASESRTKRGLLTIYGARLDGGAVEVDVIGSITPQRVLNLSFPNSRIPYRDISGEIFGANQRMEPSKLSTGFAVLFEMDALTCGLTASALDGVVESVFCEAPRSAPRA